MAIRSLRRIPTFFWIPPTSGLIYKIEIIRSDDTVDDITDITYSGELVYGATESIGNFSFTVDNSDQSRTGIWDSGASIKVYLDYGSTATTVRFKGPVEKASARNQRIRVTGRSNGGALLDVTVTKEFSSQETSTILTELLSTYTTGITTTNVNTSTTNFTVTWYQKPLWECIQDLCNAAGFDAYLDPNDDFHYFEANSVRNTTDAIIHESNLFEVGDFAPDQSIVRNRIIVYGETHSGLTIISTAEDDDSITTNKVKEKIIRDPNLTTLEAVNARAEFERSIGKDPPIVGELTSLGLPTIQPGENIRISAPLSNLPPNYYKVLSYKHKFDGIVKTVVTIDKEPRKIFHLMRDRISGEQSLADTPNPNELRFSANFEYNIDIGTHSNTEIVQGVLKTDGGGSGTWTSATTTTSSVIGKVELRVKGSTIADATYEISLDNGINFTIVTPNTAVSSIPPGNNLILRINLNSDTSEIEGAAVLYRT